MVPSHEMLAAQKAYEAYCIYTGNKSLITGDQLPKWDDLKGEIKNAWHSAAKAASDVYAMQNDTFFKPIRIFDTPMVKASGSVKRNKK